MTIAETHGKISSTGTNLHDQLEDLLTSDVFSVCKYLRSSTLFLPFLSTATSLTGKSPSLDLLADTALAKYYFWPRLAHGEPDLVVLLARGSARADLVLVEAKYFSGKSGSGLDEDELELAVAPADQLAREYEDLLTIEDQMDLETDEVRSRVLLYVTAHRSMPAASLEESTGEIVRFHPDLPAGDLYWTSWFKLLPLLDQLRGVEAWERPILDDLEALLVKKGFVSFGGFESIDFSGFVGGSLYYESARSDQVGLYRWSIERTSVFDWYRPGQGTAADGYFSGLELPPSHVEFYRTGAAR